MIKTVSVPGSVTEYSVHPECKKYTLRDNGFNESKTGKFQLIRSLRFGSDTKKDVQLKIVIHDDLKTLKMYTSIALKSVDVYKSDMYDVERTNLEAILEELCTHHVLQKVN